MDGSYRVEATGFTAPDCRITIRDGVTAVATVTVPGCTPSTLPVPAAPAPPTGSCVIDPVPTATLRSGAPSVVWFSTTGCDASSVLQWSVVAAASPPG